MGGSLSQALGYQGSKDTGDTEPASGAPRDLGTNKFSWELPLEGQFQSQNQSA